MSRVLAGLLAAAVLGAGCGGGEGDEPTIKVSAAASLKRAFEAYAESFDAARASFSFAGSDELAAQIRQGLEPDVFAAASTRLPAELHAAGLVEQPVAFAANRLAILVPDGSTEVSSIEDLARPGLRIAAGAPAVPVGSYTRAVLARLGREQARAIERNIRSNEPDVAGVVAKVAQGAVDAGFAYVTDARAGGGKVTGIELPARLQPRVAYGAAVVRGAAHPTEARRFVEGLRSRSGGRALERAGFEPPPP